jgi:L-fucose isomerase
MAIVPGEVVRLADEDLASFVEERGKHQLPIAFVEVGVDLTRFIGEFGSNHISGVAGIWDRELVLLCRMLDVEPIVMDENY